MFLSWKSFIWFVCSLLWIVFWLLGNWDLFNSNLLRSLESIAINLVFGIFFFANVIFQFVDFLLNVFKIPLKHRLITYFAIKSVGFLLWWLLPLFLNCNPSGICFRITCEDKNYYIFKIINLKAIVAFVK